MRGKQALPVLAAVCAVLCGCETVQAQVSPTADTSLTEPPETTVSAAVTAETTTLTAQPAPLTSRTTTASSAKSEPAKPEYDGRVYTFDFDPVFNDSELYSKEFFELLESVFYGIWKSDETTWVVGLNYSESFLMTGAHI